MNRYKITLSSNTVYKEIELAPTSTYANLRRQIRRILFVEILVIGNTVLHKLCESH